MKLEQASKAAMWMPTRRTSGEGRADWEEPGAGARHPLTVSTSRATGVVSTACQEGNLRQWGRLGMVGGSRTPNVIHGMTDHLGVGEGQRYRRSRVTPVEGRTLASGVLGKEEGDVDWRKPEIPTSRASCIGRRRATVFRSSVAWLSNLGS